MTWSSRSKEEGGTEWEIMKHVEAVAVELVVVGYKVVMMVVVLATEEMMWTTTTNCNLCGKAPAACLALAIAIKLSLNIWLHRVPLESNIIRRHHNILLHSPPSS